MSDPRLDTLLRAMSDGELSPEEAQAVTRLAEEDPSIAARIEFDRRLRAAVARVSGNAPIPADLKARVKSAMARADVLRPTARERVSHWFRGPSRASWLAVAASIAVVAGAILFGIYGRPIDHQPGTGVVEAPGVPPEFLAAVAREHFSCTVELKQKRNPCKYRDRAGAETCFCERFAPSRVHLVDLSVTAGYEFRGADRVELVGGGTAIRQFYERMPSRSPSKAMASIFIMRGPEEIAAELPDIALGEWRRFEDPLSRCELMASTDGLFVYLLCCCDERDLDLVSRVVTDNYLAGGQGG